MGVIGFGDVGDCEYDKWLIKFVGVVWVKGGKGVKVVWM